MSTCSIVVQLCKANRGNRGRRSHWRLYPAQQSSCRSLCKWCHRSVPQGYSPGMWSCPTQAEVHPEKVWGAEIGKCWHALWDWPPLMKEENIFKHILSSYHKVNTKPPNKEKQQLTHCFHFETAYMKAPHKHQDGHEGWQLCPTEIHTQDFMTSLRLLWGIRNQP